MKSRTDFAQILWVPSKLVKLYGHNQANRRSAFIFALHCKKVWRLLIRGAPGVTYKGDGVTYKGDGLLIRRGPPCEWVSRTDLVCNIKNRFRSKVDTVWLSKCWYEYFCRYFGGRLARLLVCCVRERLLLLVKTSVKYSYRLSRSPTVLNFGSKRFFLLQTR